MHARWDFDASSARTQRVSAPDKHQNWSYNMCVVFAEYMNVNLTHFWEHAKNFLVNVKNFKFCCPEVHVEFKAR